jgi:hypothetical protein
MTEEAQISEGLSHEEVKAHPGPAGAAVRLVQEHQGRVPSLWAARSIAQIDCVPQTLNEWVKKARGGHFSVRDGIHHRGAWWAGREVKNCARANEILKVWSLPGGLDRKLKF